MLLAEYDTIKKIFRVHLGLIQFSWTVPSGCGKLFALQLRRL